MTLRPAADDDVAALVEIRATPEVRRWWGEEDDFAAAVAEDVADVLHPGRRPRRRRDPVVRGGRPDYRHASIDIYVDPAVHGEGSARTPCARWPATSSATLGHHRLVIDPAADNAAAIRCYAKVGFRPVGVMRQYEREPTAPGTTACSWTCSPTS